MLVLLLVGLAACEKETSDEESKTNIFLKEFLDANGTRVFNSEINRTRVHFFPETNTIVYSFWKPKKLAQNGRLFLHLYPKDTSGLRPERRRYGFENLAIKKSDMLTNDSTHFFLVKKLDPPYTITSIVTGQFTDKGRAWKAEFKPQKELQKAENGTSSLVQHINCGPETDVNLKMLSSVITNALAPTKIDNAGDYAAFAGKNRDYTVFCAGKQAREMHTYMQCANPGAESGSESKTLGPMVEVCSKDNCILVFETNRDTNGCEIKVERFRSRN